MGARIDILCGDVLDRLAGIPDESVDSCVTSPPYWGLRDYGVDGQIGLVAREQGRNCIGIEISPDYIIVAQRRLGLPYSVGVFA